MNHADLAADLPFYANGTLDPARCAEIEAELAVCERCAIELHTIETLRSALLDAEQGAAASHDSDAVLADVFARIDAECGGAPLTQNVVPIGGASSAKRRLPARFFQLGGGLAAVFVAGIGISSAIHQHDVSTSLTPPVPVFRNERPVATTTEAAGFYDSVPVAPQSQAESVVAPAPVDGTVNAPIAAGAASQSVSARAFAKSVAVAAPRQLARDGTISLTVGDVEATIARIQRLAADQQGVVTHLDDDAPAFADDRHTAALTLSVPEPLFDATMEALASYGTQTARGVKTEDLSGSIVDTDARLRNLHREESDLLKIMDRSGKVTDILTVEQNLASTREQIEQLDGDEKAMRARVADASIVVTMSDEKTIVPAHPSPGVQLSNLWNRSMDDARNFTMRQLGRIFEVVVFSPYLLVLALVCYVAYRRIRYAIAGGNVPGGIS